VGRCGGEDGEEASHHVADTVFGILGGSGGALSMKQCSYPLLFDLEVVGVKEVSVVMSIIPKMMLVDAV
jgi:hypothetical protein